MPPGPTPGTAKSTPPASRPLGTSDDRFIGVGGVAIPLVILIVVGVVTIVATREIWAASPDAVHIDVQAVQFFWVVHEPDGITTANEIPVPVGKPVEIGLTSRDVIHSFWVPQLAAKVDVIPGQHNVIRFTVSQPGIYRGQCAEFCGIQHANMIFFIDAMTPADYQAWLAHHRRPPTRPNRVDRPGRGRRPGRLRERVVRRVPHRGRHHRPRHGRSGSHLPGFSADHRLGRVDQHAGQPGPLDPRQPIGQAGQRHAAQRDLRPARSTTSSPISSRRSDAAPEQGALRPWL